MDKKQKERLIKVLRREFLFSPQRKEALKKAEKLKGFFTCAKCEKNYPKDHINIDHISPVIDLTGFKDWNTFIDWLFFGELQVLCLNCHKGKSNLENKNRIKAPKIGIFIKGYKPNGRKSK